MSTELHPEVVVGALLVNDRGEVLVARFSKVQGHYVVPGGHVEYGETIAQALVREMREETGLTPTRYRLLQVSERIRPPLYKDGLRHLVYIDFLVDGWTGELQLDEDELSDGLWLLPQAALDLPLAFTTRRLIEFYLIHGHDGLCNYQPDVISS